MQALRRTMLALLMLWFVPLLPVLAVTTAPADGACCCTGRRSCSCRKSSHDPSWHDVQICSSGCRAASAIPAFPVRLTRSLDANIRAAAEPVKALARPVPRIAKPEAALFGRPPPA